MFDRHDWLALRHEEAVDPHRVIVDPHHHLWDRRGSTYLAADLRADITGSHNVVATVYVECGSCYRDGRPEALRPVGETEFVVAQAAELDAAGGPGIAGIVSHADMMLGEAVGEVLAAHEEAGANRFRGIRHATSWDPSDEVRTGHSGPAESMMGTEAFRTGVRTLASMGHTFDAWLFHTQLRELAGLARAVPEATIVLDHLGAPLGVGPYRHDRAAVLAAWRPALKEVAACPNVVLKVGGIGMEMYFGMGWADRPTPPASEEVAGFWGDEVRWCIDLFGPDRCMLESNFPVDRHTLPYPVLWNSLQIMVSGYDDVEQDQLFSGTARRVYRLGEP